MACLEPCVWGLGSGHQLGSLFLFHMASVGAGQPKMSSSRPVSRLGILERLGGQLCPSPRVPLRVTLLGFLTAWPSQGGQTSSMEVRASKGPCSKRSRKKPGGLLEVSLEHSRKSAKVLSVAAAEEGTLHLPEKLSFSWGTFSGPLWNPRQRGLQLGTEHGGGLQGPAMSPQGHTPRMSDTFCGAPRGVAQDDGSGR